MELTLLLQQIWNGLVNGMVYVQFALGLTLLFGVLRVTNISHGELLSILLDLNKPSGIEYELHAKINRLLQIEKQSSVQ